jgi:serine protease inhibitor
MASIMKPLSFSPLPISLLMAAAAFSQPVSSGRPDPMALTESNNAFAVDLYSQLREQPGNLFFSPASISTTFAMAYAGSGGSTATEMAATLHFTDPPEKLHPAMGALLATFNAPHDSYQLRVADALWAQQGEHFLPAFLQITKTDYAAGLHTVDFEHASEPARLTINQWVEQQTADKITNFLQPGSINASTRLVLTNAIYFKGHWQSQFDKAKTAQEDFYLSAENSVKAPLMHLTGGFHHFDGGTFQALEIPYQSGDLSMIVLLPNAIDGLPALERSLTAGALREWLGKLKPVLKVDLALPRFQITRQFSLNNALSALGMKQAFDPKTADFSAMTGKRGLWISAALHKAFIDVNEEGTEAAAATGTVMRSMAMVHEPPPIVFRADHPFLFLIRENRSGSILFLGRIIDPTK